MGGKGGGGGGKKGGAPPPPDYMGAARMSDISSHSNQYSPFASSTWNRAPENPAPNYGPFDTAGRAAGNPNPGGQWTQHTGFSGPLEQANQSMQGQFANGWGSPLDNGAQARQHAEDAIYGRETSRLDPMWNNREQSMRTQLEQQGIDPTSEAGTKQMESLGRTRNDAYTGALQQAIGMGGQEASRQQGMDLQSRMAPLAGLSGLQGLLSQPNSPGGGNYLAAALGLGNYGLSAAGMNNQASSDKKSGMTDLGGSTAPYWAPGLFGAGGAGGAAAAAAPYAAFI